MRNVFHPQVLIRLGRGIAFPRGAAREYSRLTRGAFPSSCWLLGACGLLAITLGCSQPAVVEAKIDPTQQQLILIGTAYQQFTFANDRPPAKPEDLKQAVTDLGGNDTVWVSPRDGQPFVIVWNVDLRQPPTWAKSTPVLAYEKVGLNGKRFVRTVVGSVEELSPPEFAAASFPPGHVPQ